MKKDERFKVDSETLGLYRSMLPYGAQKEIAGRIGVRDASICDFLAGRIYSRRIEDAVLDYIAEVRADRQAKLKAAGLL